MWRVLALIVLSVAIIGCESREAWILKNKILKCDASYLKMEGFWVLVENDFNRPAYDVRVKVDLTAFTGSKDIPRRTEMFDFPLVPERPVDGVPGRKSLKREAPHLIGQDEISKVNCVIKSFRAG